MLFRSLKLASLLPLEGQGQPLTLKTAEGVEFSAAVRPDGHKKRVALRPRQPGRLNEVITFDLEDVLTRQPPEEGKPYGLTQKLLLKPYLPTDVQAPSIQFANSRHLSEHDPYPE